MATHAAALPHTASSDRNGWIALTAFVLLTTLLLVAHLGRVLEIAFTPLAGILGVYLYRKYPKVYLFETILLVSVSAFVRRAAEGSNVRDQSLILASPLLVPFVSVLQTFRFNFLEKKHLCFTLALLGILYAAAVGVLFNGTHAVVIPLVSWLTPLVFGVFCFDLQKRYPDAKRFFTRSCLAVGIFVAVYGLIQYISPASWDVDWLTQMQSQGFASSMGSPEPYGIRVFSTTSNSQGAGALIGLCLILTTQLRARWWKLPLLLLFLSVLLLTSVRSAWVAAALVACVLLVRASTKARLQALALLGALIGVSALLSATPVGSAVITRLSSLTDVKKDNSYRERQQGRQDALELTAKTFPFGLGIGYGAGFGRHLKFAPTDVGIAPIGIELGLIGCLFYGYGLLVVLFGPLRRGIFGKGIDLALGSVLLYVLLLLSDSNFLSIAFGIFFWGPAAFLLAEPDPAEAPQHRLLRSSRRRILQGQA